MNLLILNIITILLFILSIVFFIIGVFLNIIMLGLFGYCGIIIFGLIFVIFTLDNLKGGLKE